MQQRHARYPFFAPAREAVQQVDEALSELVTRDAAAVDRGRERVERALLEGTVAAEDPTRWDPRDELLSYPIARVLVSLIDSPAAVEKYAEAEAATAYERFTDDFAAGDDGLRSTPTDRADLDDVLREFGLDDAVAAERTNQATAEPVGRTAGGRSAGRSGGGSSRPVRWFRVDVTAYLRLAGGWSDRWRLVNRELAAGEVRVEREELYRMLREAVRRQVAEGLPFDVAASPDGEVIADALEPTVTDLRDLLADRDEIGEIDTVVPDLFPPCMTELVERARRGSEFDPHESFALMAFLTGIGMDADEIIDFCRSTSLEEAGIRYQTEYLRDERGTQYPPPSCETLHAYGLCDNEDDHWELASHPLVYYQRRLHQIDEEPTDWRERDGGEAQA